MKKAQAATEFLFTYGWIFLVVLLSIGILSYFGVVEPERFLPEKCVLFPGLYCYDFKATSDTIILGVKNSMGKELVIEKIDFKDLNCGKEFNIQLADEEINYFNIGCDLNAYSRIKSGIFITYKELDGLSHTQRGNLVTNVEKLKEIGVLDIWVT